MLTIPAVLASQVRYGRSHALAMCWKISWKDNPSVVYRFTDWPVDLQLRELDSTDVFDYTPTGGLDATARRRSDEIEPQNKELRGVITDAAITSADLRAGRFDGAQVDEYLVDPRTAWAGAIEHTCYYIRTVSYDRGVWTAQVAGIASYLGQPTGEVWGPTCRTHLFSPQCGLDPEDYEVHGDVDSITTQRLVFVAGITHIGDWDISGYGDDGLVIWRSGLNVGRVDEIKVHVAGATDNATITLQQPTPFDIAVADSLTLWPGCDKQPGIVGSNKGDCTNTFDNLINFQGEPFIPGRDRGLEPPKA